MSFASECLLNKWRNKCTSEGRIKQCNRDRFYCFIWKDAPTQGSSHIWPIMVTREHPFQTISLERSLLESTPLTALGLFFWLSHFWSHEPSFEKCFWLLQSWQPARIPLPSVLSGLPLWPSILLLPLILVFPWIPRSTAGVCFSWLGNPGLLTHKMWCHLDSSNLQFLDRRLGNLAIYYSEYYLFSSLFLWARIFPFWPDLKVWLLFKVWLACIW